MLVVQPWTVATGHPAQSLIYTARMLEGRMDVQYLIARPLAAAARADAVVREVSQYAPVSTYSTVSTSIRESTVRALAVPVLRSSSRILFFDAHLVLLAAAWLSFRPRSTTRLGALYVAGPRKIARSPIARRLVRSFLKRDEVRLYLRSDELADAWRCVFADVPEGTIRTLPSLELPDSPIPGPPPQRPDRHVAILGQIRRGKSIEWLVPAFRRDPGLGRLTIAGGYADAATQRSLGLTGNGIELIDTHVSETDLLSLATAQDYLLMLYDEWDRRMEAASLYLAARANRPVVTFDDGWCGRMVRQYGCGVALPVEDRNAALARIGTLPGPGSPEYHAMLRGLGAFRASHGPDSVLPMFMAQLE